MGLIPRGGGKRPSPSFASSVPEKVIAAVRRLRPARLCRFRLRSGPASAQPLLLPALAGPEPFDQVVADTAEELAATKFGDHTGILALAVEDQDLAIEHDVDVLIWLARPVQELLA